MIEESIPGIDDSPSRMTPQEKSRVKIERVDALLGTKYRVSLRDDRYPKSLRPLGYVGNWEMGWDWTTYPYDLKGGGFGIRTQAQAVRALLAFWDREDNES